MLISQRAKSGANGFGRGIETLCQIIDRRGCRGVPQALDHASADEPLKRVHTPLPAQRRPQERGSTPKTRSSCAHRQPFAMRAAHATASSREGSSSTVKPPSSGGAHG